MRQALVLCATVFALAGCSQTGKLETGIAPNATFNALQLPAGAFASPREVIAHYLEPLGRSEADEQEVGNYSGGSGDRLLLFSVEGLEDDSVSGEQFRVVLDQADDGLRVVSAGVRYRCARGDADNWTASTCP